MRQSRLVFSPSVEAAAGALAPNPKRARRTAEKQLVHAGTRSQQALQLQREAGKLQRQSVNKAQKEAEKERRFALKQQKRKEKHRGR